MTSHLTITPMRFGEAIEVRVVIESADVLRLNLDAFDRALLADTVRQSPADVLLTLEMLFRRMQEQLTPPR